VVALATALLLLLGTTITRWSPQAEAVSPPRKISAWLPYWDARGNQTFLDNADLFADLSPFWYELSATGTITPYAGAADATVVNGAKSKGVAVIPTISNAFDAARVHSMLATATTRAAHVSAIVNLVTSKGYDGFDVDYESLQAADRDLYSAFIAALATALHGQGKKLTVAVHPKTSEPGTWDGPPAQNYAAIGQSADKVRVMAYDYHWDSSPAGAVAPIGWVDQVAQFSASQIPPAKVQLGVPLYGYDWVGSTGTGQVWTDLEKTRTAANATRQWSSADAAPWFSYSANGTAHVAWYEDAQSVDAKLAIVDKYGLGGAIFWRLGGEDPAVWTKARSRWGVAPTTTTTAPTTTAVTDTIAPTVPASLTGTPGSRSASLKWSPSTDVGGSGLNGYDVYRARSSTGTYTKIATTTATSFVNTGLPGGLTYWYFVKARDGAGNLSSASNKVSVRPA
jgi:spore germination protein YaaH